MDSLTLDQLWEIVEIQLNNNKEPYKDLEAIYEFDIDNHEKWLYQIVFHNGEATIYNSREHEPDCALSMNETDFKKLLFGKLNSTMAFMTGKLKVNGNIRLALTLENMLKQYEIPK